MDRIFQWPVVIAFVLLLVMLFVLRKTQFGAMSTRSEATVKRPCARVFLSTASNRPLPTFGATAGIAGVLTTARFSGGSSIAGDPLLSLLHRCGDHWWSQHVSRSRKLSSLD